MTEPAKPPEAPAAAPAIDPIFEIKFNGQSIKYDLTKAEDRGRLKTDAELGRFAEKQTAQVKAAQERAAALEADAQLGKSWREFAAQNPDGSAVMAGLMQGLREGRVDPSQIRQALAAKNEGDATSLEAQARASTDPQLRAALQSMAAELQGVTTEIKTIKQTAAQRELEVSITSTLSSDPFLKRSPTALGQAARRTRELVADGMPLDQAAPLAAREVKDLANELANVDRERARDGEEFRTAKSSLNLPPLQEHLAKAVDPKAPPRVQQAQRRDALKDRFRAFQRHAEGQ